MASLNKIMIIGHLGADPEMSYSPSGVPVTKFRVAASRRFTTQEGEKREETEWFNVVTFRKTAEIANQYLHKGSSAYVEGRMTSSEYTDRDNVKRRWYEIHAFEIQLLDSRPRDGGEASSSGPSSGQGGPSNYDEDDLPF